MQFDMNATWQRATALVRANFQLLAIIAGVFLLVPSIVLYLAVPDMAMFANPSADADAMAAQMEAMAPTIMGWSAVLLIFQMVGYVAMVALMGHHRPTVGEALARGFKALPSIFGAGLLALVAYAIIILIAVLVIGALSALTGAAAIGAILFLALVPVIFVFFIRFSLVIPVIVLEGTLNPMTAMARSWRLTQPSRWRLAGFWALLLIAYFVLAFLLLGLVGVLGAFASTSSGSLLVLGIVNGLIGALVAMYFSAILVAMHEQLAGQRPETISQTFD